MSSNAATVEVLTAEVRTLMVGSRQVTLSVYRQLDEAMPEEFEPFGRVNLKYNEEIAGIDLVGRHIPTGVLAACHLNSRSRFIPDHWVNREVPGWYTYTRTRHPGRHGYLQFEGIDVGLQIPEVDRMGRPPNPDFDQIESDVMALAKRHLVLLNLYERWSALPLIVLAGLR